MSHRTVLFDLSFFHDLHDTMGEENERKDTLEELFYILASLWPTVASSDEGQLIATCFP